MVPHGEERAPHEGGGEDAKDAGAVRCPHAHGAIRASIDIEDWGLITSARKSGVVLSLTLVLMAPAWADTGPRVADEHRRGLECTPVLTRTITAVAVPQLGQNRKQQLALDAIVRSLPHMDDEDGDGRPQTVYRRPVSSPRLRTAPLPRPPPPFLR